jgi:hypothetical protein
LLDREAAQVLSLDALAGLYGELWHLRRCVSLNPASFISWQGPRGARHDFVGDGISLEVKATLARDGWRLRVHGLSQLDFSSDASLFVGAVRLELSAASGETVPGIIEKVVQLGVERREILEVLLLAGYDVRDEEHYEQSRFSVLETRVFEVGSSFPRMVPASFLDGCVPVGVEDVHYTIDLVAGGAKPLSEESTQDVFARISSRRDESPGPSV